MITKRSNHMPTFTNRQRTNSTAMLRRTDLNHSSSGKIDVAGEHGPARPPEVAGEAPPEHVALELARPVPGAEELAQVRVADDRRGEQHQLRELLDVVDRDDVLELVALADDDQQVDDQRHAREDRARHEVGREDRAVPARHLRHREVPRHDAVHRQHQRRGEGGEVEIGAVVVLPLRVRRPSSRTRRSCRAGGGSGSWPRRAAPRRRESRPTMKNTLETVR